MSHVQQNATPLKTAERAEQAKVRQLKRRTTTTTIKQQQTNKQ
jgi:hypothetical protein